MKTKFKKAFLLLFTAMLLTALTAPALAAGEPGDGSTDAQTAVQTETEDLTTGDKAIGAGIAIGLAAAAGAIGMGIAVAKSAEGIARQPEAESKIRTTLMLGLVFIETAIIYALLVVILIIFVL